MSIYYDTLITFFKPSNKGLIPFSNLSRLIKFDVVERNIMESSFHLLFRLLKHEKIVESVFDSFQARKK